MSGLAVAEDAVPAAVEPAVTTAAADAPAAAPAAAADASAPAAAPVAAPVPEPKLDSGNTAWMLTATALVLFMTIPGLALFYGGMVRKKNVLSTMMQSFAITALMTIIWMVAGYSLAFAPGAAVHRRAGQDVPQRRGCERTDRRSRRKYSGNRVRDLPDDLCHHHPGPDHRCLCRSHEVLRDAVVHGHLVAGGVRTDYSLGVGRHGGWLFTKGILDYAGGTVVHINAGIAGLVVAIVLGKRVGYGKEADGAAQPGADHHGRCHAVGGLVRLQRRLRSGC